NRRVPFRHAPRRRSTLPFACSRYQYLRQSLYFRVRQPLPIFLPCGRLRDGGGQRGAAAEDQFLELCALQDVRYRRSLSNHRLGAAGGRRRAELRRDVEATGPRLSGEQAEHGEFVCVPTYTFPFATVGTANCRPRREGCFVPRREAVGNTEISGGIDLELEQRFRVVAAGIGVKWGTVGRGDK